VRVLVAGSTSVLGRAIIAELKARGHTVRALSRSAERLRDAGADEVVVGDAADPASLTAAMQGAGAVISSVGASVLPDPRRGVRGFMAVDWPLNRNLADSAAAAGIERFVYVSVFGADRKRSLVYCDAHERVGEYLRERGLQPCIVRPTAFFSALREFIGLAELGLIPVFGGRNQTNPIHDADLAVACVEALSDKSAEKDIGGPEVLTRRDIAALAARAVGKQVWLLPLPAFVLRLAAVFMLPLPRVSQLLSFYAHAMGNTLVAPKAGRRRLGEYFAECVQERKR
jgi:uncharacterized protein YbjT (DUF2867 family)